MGFGFERNTTKKGNLDVEIKYDGVNTRPSEFVVKYEVDGKYFENSIMN